MQSGIDGKNMTSVIHLEGASKSETSTWVDKIKGALAEHIARSQAGAKPSRGSSKGDDNEKSERTSKTVGLQKFDHLLPGSKLRKQKKPNFMVVLGAGKGDSESEDEDEDDSGSDELDESAKSVSDESIPDSGGPVAELNAENLEK